MSAIERYLAPTGLAEALDILASGPVTVLAGGTDLMPQSQAGRVTFAPTLMNIRRIEALRGVREEGGFIRIGALTTITDLLDNPLINGKLAILAEAADHFASPQIRNAGTLGGNIGNASPAGDTLVPLLVLDAEVELVSKSGARHVPMAQFFTGPGKTVRTAGELIAAVRVPTPKLGFTARFAKFGVRPALDISTVSVGIGGVTAGGTFEGVRVAFGAVAPTPIRGAKTEAALSGKKLDNAAIETAAKAAFDEVKPISDVRASAWYRKELIRNLTRKVLNDVAGA